MDGAVEGHCDCMFMVNTYRWDYAKLAALIAPRALLLSNSDKDTIFPLDGVRQKQSSTWAVFDSNVTAYFAACPDFFSRVIGTLFCS